MDEVYKNIWRVNCKSLKSVPTQTRRDIFLYHLTNPPSTPSPDRSQQRESCFISDSIYQLPDWLFAHCEPRFSQCGSLVLANRQHTSQSPSDFISLQIAIRKKKFFFSKSSTYSIHIPILFPLPAQWSSGCSQELHQIHDPNFRNNHYDSDSTLPLSISFDFRLVKTFLAFTKKD